MENWLSNWSSNPTIIVAVIAIIGLIWQGGRWTGRIENGLKSLGERMGAELTRLEARIDTGLKTLQEETRHGLKTLRDEMRHEHAETRRTLDTLLLRVGGGTPSTAGSSPLKLTEFGKKIETMIEPAEWVAVTRERLRPESDGLEPFEIDALCRRHVGSCLDTEWQRRVARTAYELGTDNRAVEEVLRVLLRDALVASASPPPNQPPGPAKQPPVDRAPGTEL